MKAKTYMVVLKRTAYFSMGEVEYTETEECDHFIQAERVCEKLRKRYKNVTYCRIYTIIQE